MLIVVHHLYWQSKNNFLVLDEGPTEGINYSISAAEKEFIINFNKAKTKFCLSLHYNGYKICLYVNKAQ